MIAPDRKGLIANKVRAKGKRDDIEIDYGRLGADTCAISSRNASIATNAFGSFNRGACPTFGTVISFARLWRFTIFSAISG